jgi:formate dehydrogenase major subunit
VDAPDKPGNEIVFDDGFPTESGRGKLTPANIIPPDEQPDEDFPMVLTTGRQLEHWHTGAMTRRSAILDHLEPEAIAQVSSRDLHRLGLRPGDTIRVETRRGVVELMARVDGAIPEGLIFIPFCYAEAPANLLTNPKLDPFGKIPEFKYCAARISKPDAVAAE